MSASHAGFILAAYAITAIVALAMIGAIVLDHRALKKALAAFPARDSDAS